MHLQDNSRLNQLTLQQTTTTTMQLLLIPAHVPNATKCWVALPGKHGTCKSAVQKAFLNLRPHPRHHPAPPKQSST